MITGEEIILDRETVIEIFDRLGLSVYPFLTDLVLEEFGEDAEDSIVDDSMDNRSIVEALDKRASFQGSLTTPGLELLEREGAL